MAHLPALSAERQLRQIEATSMPHFKDNVRKRIYARLERRLRRDKPQTAGEALATLPIPVVYESAKPKGGEH
jgi:hypothetical protein